MSLCKRRLNTRMALLCMLLLPITNGLQFYLLFQFFFRSYGDGRKGDHKLSCAAEPRLGLKSFLPTGCFLQNL